MTRYSLALKRYACPSCGTKNLVQPIRSISTLVEGLAMPSEEVLLGVTACNKCGKEFATAEAEFLGWINENTQADPKVVEKYAVPAFLRKSGKSESDEVTKGASSPSSNGRSRCTELADRPALFGKWELSSPEIPENVDIPAVLRRKKCRRKRS